MMLKFSRSKNESAVRVDSAIASTASEEQGYGLKLLSDFPDTKPIFDVICVHGLNGNCEKTWTSKDNVLWIRDLLPVAVPGIRVFTFGYDAKPVGWRSVVSQNRIGDHSRNLLHAVSSYRENDGSSTRPIIFLAHSLGGLVCEDAILSSRNSADVNLQLIFKHTYGILFLGTPHYGAALAKWAENLCKVLGFFKNTTVEIVQVLTRESEILSRIQTDFHTMVRAMSRQGRSFEMTCFYEELPIPGLGLVVPKTSAALLGYPHIGVHANHMDMARFSSAEDAGFLAISGELNRWKRDLYPVLEQSKQTVRWSHYRKPIFHIPYDRHQNFVGREAIFSELQRCIELEQSAVLSGIDQNPKGNVFWIPADTRLKFDQGYRDIAEKLGLERWDDSSVDIVRLVVEYLTRETTEPYVIVLDNADDIDIWTGPEDKAGIAITKLIPKSPIGQVIITTRDNHVGQILTNWRAPIPVDLMSLSDAKILLLSSITSPCKVDEKEVLEVIQILDSLPLAITQATAYINGNNITLRQYLIELTEYEVSLQILLSEDQFDKRRGFDSVVRTWKISFEHIKRKHVDAAQLLATMACFDRQEIPRELLLQKFPSQRQLTKALGILQAFSLVKLDRIGTTYSMHKLVQVVMRMWIELQGSKTIHEEESIKFVSQNFPSHENEDLKTSIALLPHACVVEQYTTHNIEYQDSLARLRFCMAWFYYRQGLYDAANERCTKAFQAQKEIHGEKSLITLHTSDLMGTIATRQGYFKIALSIHKETLRMKEDLLGPDDLDVLQTLSYLADLEAYRSNPVVAEAHWMRVLQGRKEQLGSNHPETIACIRGLAHASLSLKKLELSEELARQSLQADEHIWGGDHPSTLLSMSVLASALRGNGRHQEALRLNLLVVSGRDKVLGKEHPHTLAAFHDLGLIYYKLGDLQKAETIYRSVRDRFLENLGPENPETVTTTYHLACVLRDQKKFVEAKKLMREVWAKCETKRGKDHGTTLGAQSNYARLLDLEGEYEEAQTITEYVLEAREKIYGSTNPRTLMSYFSLGMILQHKKDFRGAERLLEQALNGRKKISRKTHPRTLDCQFQLGLLYEEMSRLSEALQSFQECLEGTVAEFGLQHPLTLERREKVKEIEEHVSRRHRQRY